MGSGEEYLDNLLKSVSGDSGEQKAMTEEEIAALFSPNETSATGNTQNEPNIDTFLDDILALADTASDFSAEISGEDFASVTDSEFVLDDTAENFDFALDELGAEPFADEDLTTGDFAVEDFAAEDLEMPGISEDSVVDTTVNMQTDDTGFLNDEQVQNLIEQDAELFETFDDQSDLVDLESFELEEELVPELVEEHELIIEDVPDTEVIEQSDMLDIASMFDADEDLTEGVTYDTTGFYDDESAEDEFNPFADMSDIDDLLKAVNWSDKSEEEESGEKAESGIEGGVFLENIDQLTTESLDELMSGDTQQSEEPDVNDFDLSALDESGDEDMAELGALLKAADGDSSALDMLEQLPDDGPTGVAILHGEGETAKERKARLKQEKAAMKARKKAEKNDKKALKEVEDMPEPAYKKVAANPDNKPEKGGFFARVINALLEDDEEEQEKKKPTEEIIQLDENGAIPDDIDKDENNKKVKEKKEKPKKEKKEKPKKEKKVRVKKEKVIDIDPPAKIRKASVKIVLGFAASVLVCTLLGNSVVEPLISKHNAKKAFREQQYEECYLLFAGQSLSENEQLMLDHAAVVLKMQRTLTRYDEYINYKDRQHAIDVLFEAVNDFDENYQKALNCGAKAEVETIYAQILSSLEMYGVSESLAKQIVSLDDVSYTRIVTALSEGESFEEYLGVGSEAGEITDLLPGEMD